MSQTADATTTHYRAHIEYGAYSSASRRAETLAGAMSAVLDLAEYYVGIGETIRGLYVEESCPRCAGHGVCAHDKKIGRGKVARSFPECGACKGAGYKTVTHIAR